MTATTSATVKFVVFAVVTALMTALLAVAIAGTRLTDTVSYRAVFTDASGLQAGQDVRISGVRAGTVSDIHVVDRDKALVTFSVLESWPLTTSTRAQIRYLNLVGDRYLEITEGSGSSQRLQQGGVLPVSQTRPALDLTVLFNGFKPLFRALSPKQVNRLASEIVAVLQGEAGTVNSLLAHTASLTNTLADRDKVIGDLIDNLNTVLATLDERDRRLSRLILQLQRFVSGLAADREAIGESLEHVNELAGATTDLLVDARPPLRADIRELGKLSRNLARNKGIIAGYLDGLPAKLNDINKTASYGSWFNFYLCNLDATAGLPGEPVRQVEVHNETARCQP